MTFDLNDVLTQTEIDGLNSAGSAGSAGGNSVISAEHDASKIKVDLPSAGDVQSRLDSMTGKNRPAWDANEYVYSEAEARRIIEEGSEAEKQRLFDAAQRRANLATTADGRIAVFVANDQFGPAWHELGTLLREAANRQEAMLHSGLGGMQIVKIPTVVRLPDGSEVETGHFAVVRLDTGDVIGNVGKGYHVVPPETAFDVMDDIFQTTGLRYESAGALGKGERFWLLARAPETLEVARGDVLERFVAFLGSHDGSGALKLFGCDDRIVCHNTYSTAARKNKGKGISIRHTKNVKRKIGDAQRALGVTMRAQEQFAEQARALVAQPLRKPAEYFDVVLDDVLDVTIAEQRLTGNGIADGSVLKSILEIADVEKRREAEKQYDRAVKRRGNILDDILDRYESERCNGLPSISGSAWSAVNAVTEFSNHSELVRYQGDSRTRAENRFMSVVDGRAAEIQRIAIEKTAGAL